MKDKIKNIKKVWIRPNIKLLNIKTTNGGVGGGTETSSLGLGQVVS